jgi:hypothetical protein
VDSIVADVMARLPVEPSHARMPRVYVVEHAALRTDRAGRASGQVLTPLATEQARAVLATVEEATRAGWSPGEVLARLATIMAHGGSRSTPQPR